MADAQCACERYFLIRRRPTERAHRARTRPRSSIVRAGLLHNEDQLARLPPGSQRAVKVPAALRKVNTGIVTAEIVSAPALKSAIRLSRRFQPTLLAARIRPNRKLMKIISFSG